MPPDRGRVQGFPEFSPEPNERRRGAGCQQIRADRVDARVVHQRLEIARNADQILAGKTGDQVRVDYRNAAVDPSQHTVERLLILSAGAEVNRRDVDHLVAGGARTDGLPGELLGLETFGDFKDAAERAFILKKLQETDWNVSEAARRMDMPRSNLYKKIEKYGLQRD